MEFDGISAQERGQLLKRHADYKQQRLGSDDSTERRRLMALCGSLEVEYSDCLPRVPLSRCPFCEQPLVRAFDPYGLDGFWWHAVSPILYTENPPCEHFALLQGAVDLRGRTPHEVTTAVEPGPAVPFIIERLLNLEGMQAVCFAMKLESGDMAYPIAYFSTSVPPSSELHQPWARRGYQLVDDEGAPKGWTVKVDALDYELQPWIDRGKLLWIDAEDPGMTLHGASDGPSPYVGLNGDRQPQLIRDAQCVLLPSPEGGVAEPFD